MDQLEHSFNRASGAIQDSASKLNHITDQLGNNASITSDLLSKIESQTEKFHESEKKRDQNEERRSASTSNLIQTIEAQTKAMQQAEEKRNHQMNQVMELFCE